VPLPYSGDPFSDLYTGPPIVITTPKNCSEKNKIEKKNAKKTCKKNTKNAKSSFPPRGIEPRSPAVCYSQPMDRRLTGGYTDHYTKEELMKIGKESVI
jgi:hypothetical protein